MDELDLQQRTKLFTLRVMELLGALPNTLAGRAIGGQLARSGTSVGSNDRAACKGRSTAEFVAKLGTVEVEADESAFWMELLVEGALIKNTPVQPLWNQAKELEKIMAASRRTAERTVPEIADRKLSIAN